MKPHSAGQRQADGRGEAPDQDAVIRLITVRTAM